LSGNGYAAQGNNFGIGLTTPGTNDNIIVDNFVVGNTNGITLVAGVEGNIIAGNLVVGNPPVQVSVTIPTTPGVDIRNLATPGSNVVEGNVCLTTVNAVCATADTRRGQR
jgi:parallel beta-helix repeat protein